MTTTIPEDTPATGKPGPFRRRTSLLVLAAASLMGSLGSTAEAQLYTYKPETVGGPFPENGVHQYDTVTGSLIGGFVANVTNPNQLQLSGSTLYALSFTTVTSYSAATGTQNSFTVTTPGPGGSIAVQGSNLYASGPVFNGGGFDGVVGFYNATTGATVNSAFITLANANNGPLLTLSGNTLFTGIIGNVGSGTGVGTIGSYNATTGAAINASLITGLATATSSLADIVASGTTLYVATNILSGATITGFKIGSYDTSTGAAINASLLTGSGSLNDVAVSGNSLFVDVANGSTYAVSSYNATTGAAINPSLLSGGDRSIAVAPVPEPCSAALLFAGAAAVLGLRRRFRH